jgi:hypothetical protein
MPGNLANLTDDLVNRAICRRPIDLGFEPLPEALNGIVLGGIRLQMFECNPVMLRHKPFDRSALVNLRVIEDQQNQRVWKTLMELV